MHEVTYPFGDMPSDFNGDLPYDLKYAPDPMIQCGECEHCHAVDLLSRDGKTKLNEVLICTLDPNEPEHVFNPDEWHNLKVYDCYEGMIG